MVTKNYCISKFYSCETNTEASLLPKFVGIFDIDEYDGDDRCPFFTVEEINKMKSSSGDNLFDIEGAPTLKTVDGTQYYKVGMYWRSTDPIGVVTVDLSTYYDSESGTTNGNGKLSFYIKPDCIGIVVIHDKNTKQLVSIGVEKAYDYGQLREIDIDLDPTVEYNYQFYSYHESMCGTMIELDRS